MRRIRPGSRSNKSVLSPKLTVRYHVTTASFIPKTSSMAHEGTKRKPNKQTDDFEKIKERNREFQGQGGGFLDPSRKFKGV